jgi:hypothetical protein
MSFDPRIRNRLSRLDRDPKVRFSSMIFIDLPSPAEASNEGRTADKGFAQAQNRCPLFGIMLRAA